MVLKFQIKITLLKFQIKIKEMIFLNLILCSENCKHQKDGYCCLEEYGAITDVISSPCAYFDEKKESYGNDKSGKSH